MTECSFIRSIYQKKSNNYKPKQLTMGKQTLLLTPEHLKEEFKKKAFAKVQLEHLNVNQTLVDTHDTIMYAHGEKERYLKGQTPKEESTEE